MTIPQSSPPVISKRELFKYLEQTEKEVLERKLCHIFLHYMHFLDCSLKNQSWTI